jgi:hypothetical protein
MKYLLLVLFCISCGDDGCKTGEMKCVDNAVSICNSDNEWDMMMDCDELDIEGGGVSTCGFDSDIEVYTCEF